MENQVFLSCYLRFMIVFKKINNYKHFKKTKTNKKGISIKAACCFYSYTNQLCTSTVCNIQEEQLCGVEIQIKMAIIIIMSI